MNKVENCYEENSDADDVTSATTRCCFGFDTWEPLYVNCTVSEPDRDSRSKTNYLIYGRHG